MLQFYKRLFYPKCNSRFVACVQIFPTKPIIGNENEAIHQYFEKSPRYKNILLNTSKPSIYSNCSKEFSKCFKDFTKLTDIYNLDNTHKIELDNIKTIFKNIIDNITIIDDDEFLQIVKYLQTWTSIFHPRNQLLREFWRSIDSDCLKRTSNWDIDKKLYVGNLWYRCGLGRFNKYNEDTINLSLENVKKLKTSQFIYTLFLINVRRLQNPKHTSILENKLFEIINNLEKEELAIACASFFKSQTKFKNKNLVKRILSISETHLMTMDDIFQVMILKQLRYSFSFGMFNKYSKVITPIIDRTSNTSMMVLIHYLTTAISSQNYLPQLLDNIVDQMIKRFDEMRIKDVSKVLLGLTYFNHSPKSPKLFEELNNLIQSDQMNSDIENFPEYLISCLHSLSFWNVYPRALVDKVFSDAFRANLTNSRGVSFYQDLMGLHYNLTIKHPDYPGIILEESYLARYIHKFQGQIPSPDSPQLSKQNQCMLRLLQLLKKKYPKGVCIKHVLPHFSLPDVVLCVDDQGKPHPIPSSYRQAPSHLPLAPPDKSFKWYCFVLCTLQYYSWNSPRPYLLGRPQLKLRLLSHMGYHPIEVPINFITQYNSKTHGDNLLEYLMAASSSHQNPFFSRFT